MDGTLSGDAETASATRPNMVHTNMKQSMQHSAVERKSPFSDLVDFLNVTLGEVLLEGSLLSEREAVIGKVSCEYSLESRGCCRGLSSESVTC